MKSDTLKRVREIGRKRVILTRHAVEQIGSDERGITGEEIVAVVLRGQLVEDYPGDERGSSCLLLGFGREGRPIHVVCSPQDDYVSVVTAYLPDSERWSQDFRTRVR